MSKKDYYLYIDSNGLPVSSQTPIEGLTPFKAETTDENTVALWMLPRMIDKQMESPQTVRRWDANYSAAEKILLGKASDALMTAFNGLLDANKLDNPEVYSGMTLREFARPLLDRQDALESNCLQLETQRLLKRMELTNEK